MGLLDWFNDYKNTILGQKYIDKAYDTYGGLERGGSLMKSDAMRHLLWTGEMSRKFNPTIAKGISDWHEKVVTPWKVLGGAHPNQPEGDKQMDLYNNALGIKIGQNSNSYADTERLAREAVDSDTAFIQQDFNDNKSDEMRFKTNEARLNFGLIGAGLANSRPNKSIHSSSPFDLRNFEENTWVKHGRNRPFLGEGGTYPHKRYLDNWAQGLL